MRKIATVLSEWDFWFEARQRTAELVARRPAPGPEDEDDMGDAAPECPRGHVHDETCEADCACPFHDSFYSGPARQAEPITAEEDLVDEDDGEDVELPCSSRLHDFGREDEKRAAS